MKIWKAIVKTLFGLLIVALLLAPLYLINRLSKQEMEAYAAPEIPVLRQSAFGEAVQAKRTDVAVFTTVSGVGTSSAYADVELHVRRPDLIRWEIGVGDVVTEGQTVGVCKEEPILSTCTGVVESINAYTADNAYLRVRLLDPCDLECRVNSSVLHALENAEALTDADGNVLSLAYVSPICNADGTVTVRLRGAEDRFRYGETVEALRVYTGKSYPNTLVLNRSCLYRKSDADNAPWYVRRVTEDGYFLAEQEVRVGYSTDAFACVSGIEEGAWFDAGAEALQKGESHE